LETLVTRAAVVIPARYASSRLPGKPILERVRRATGKYLIQHVYERVRQAASIDTVVVATDDRRILEAVQQFGGIARMTSPAHRSGTDRVAEVAEAMDHPVVVNVQGDEPEILPEQVDQVVALLAADETASMATLACPIHDVVHWRDPNAVKAVVDSAGNALYFSRSPIPYMRDVDGLPEDAPARPLHHLGIYAYRRDFLLAYADLPASPLEQAEKLEQLRALDAGHRIKVGVTEHMPCGIDTPEDLEAWLASRADSDTD
jgi:3-deoxy-manno-octulosonate cytidylyltransferase (CMP-KDO synthetase)